MPVNPGHEIIEGNSESGGELDDGIDPRDPASALQEPNLGAMQ
jgi:hypothetical protein